MDAVTHTRVTCADGARTPAAQWLRRPDTTLDQLRTTGAVVLEVAPGEEATVCWSVETACKYSGYLERQKAAVARARRLEARRIPAGITYGAISGLSAEVVERLSAVRPETIGQASRIPGVTPAAVELIACRLDR